MQMGSLSTQVPWETPRAQSNAAVPFSLLAIGPCIPAAANGSAVMGWELSGDRIWGKSSPSL